MKEVLLDIQNLKKSFDGVSSVNDVSISIKNKNITLITGKNGAGKTTLFNLISGLEKPTHGNILFNGVEISNATPLFIARLGVVRLYQQPRLFKNLMVWENLLSAAHEDYSSNFIKLILYPGKVKAENENQKLKAFGFLQQFGLEDLSNKVAGNLSYGQQKLVSFCMIAMNGTKLALLDEPFAGLNPQMIDKLVDIVLHMREKGITFLLIEHNLNKALPLCDRHIVMDEGKIVETNSNHIIG